MARQAEQSPVAAGCQICCAPHRSDVWEKAKYLHCEHAVSHRHLTQHVCQFDIWTANASCYIQELHIFLWVLIKIAQTRFVKQNIKAHQHPLIKVSIIKTRLSTSMGNQGTVVTLTGRWPIIDSKNRVTVFSTKTSNLANHPRGLFSMEIIRCQANNYNTFLWWWMPALSFIIEQLKTKAPRQWNSLRTSY